MQMAVNPGTFIAISVPRSGYLCPAFDKKSQSMKKLFTLLAFASMTFVTSAQTANNPTKSDPDAKKILDAVSAKFRTFSSLQASFTYQVENAQGKSLSSKRGTVVM